MNNLTISTAKGTEANPRKMLTIKGSVFAMDELPSKETEKAYLFNVLNTGCCSNKDYWIPKSLLSQDGSEWVLPAWFISKNFGYIA